MQDYLSMNLAINPNNGAFPTNFTMAKVQKDTHSSPSDDNSSSYEGSSFSQSLSKPKKAYTKIPNELRNALINAVENGNERIKQAAQRLGINYSSAKTIIQIYRNEGRTFKKFKTKKADRRQETKTISSEVEDNVRKQFKADTYISESAKLNSKTSSNSDSSKSGASEYKLTTPRGESVASTELTNTIYYQNDGLNSGDSYEQTYDYGQYDSDSQSTYYDNCPPNTLEINGNYVTEKSFITYDQEPTSQYVKSYSSPRDEKTEVSTVVSSNQSTNSQAYPSYQSPSPSQQVNTQGTPNQFTPTYCQITPATNYNQAPQFPANNNNFQIQSPVQNNNNNNNAMPANNGSYMTPYIVMNQYNPNQPQQFPSNFGYPQQIFIINQDQEQGQNQINPQQFQQFMPSPVRVAYNAQPQQFIMQQNQPQQNFQNQPQQFISYQDQNQNQNKVQDNGQNQQFMVQNMPPQYYQPQFCPMPAPIIYIVEGDFNPAQAQNGKMNFQQK